MKTWSAIYDQCSRILLEDGGFVLGLITDEEFYSICGSVLTDFLGSTGLDRKIFADTLHYGVDTYQEPDNIGDVLEVIANGQSISRTSGFFLDNSDDAWFTNIGSPYQFREDELTRGIQLTPAPNMEGFGIAMDPGNPGFGVLSATRSPNDFDIVADYSTITGSGLEPYTDISHAGLGIVSSIAGDATIFNPGYGGVIVSFTGVPTVQDLTPGYGILNDFSGQTIGNPIFGGVISTVSGNPYVETINPGYGVPEYIIPSAGNIQMIGTAVPDSTIGINGPTVIEMVPDSFIPYLKYGVLANIYGSDSELRDEMKAAYCKARYEEGLNAVSALLGDETILASRSS